MSNKINNKTLSFRSELLTASENLDKHRLCAPVTQEWQQSLDEFCHLINTEADKLLEKKQFFDSEKEMMMMTDEECSNSSDDNSCDSSSSANSSVSFTTAFNGTDVLSNCLCENLFAVTSFLVETLLSSTTTNTINFDSIINNNNNNNSSQNLQPSHIRCATKLAQTLRKIVECFYLDQNCYQDAKNLTFAAQSLEPIVSYLILAVSATLLSPQFQQVISTQQQQQQQQSNPTTSSLFQHFGQIDEQEGKVLTQIIHEFYDLSIASMELLSTLALTSPTYFAHRLIQWFDQQQPSSSSGTTAIGRNNNSSVAATTTTTAGLIPSLFQHLFSLGTAKSNNCLFIFLKFPMRHKTYWQLQRWNISSAQSTRAFEKIVHLHKVGLRCVFSILGTLKTPTLIDIALNQLTTAATSAPSVFASVTTGSNYLSAFGVFTLLTENLYADPLSTFSPADISSPLALLTSSQTCQFMIALQKISLIAVRKFFGGIVQVVLSKDNVASLGLTLQRSAEWIAATNIETSKETRTVLINSMLTVVRTLTAIQAEPKFSALASSSTNESDENNNSNNNNKIMQSTASSISNKGGIQTQQQQQSSTSSSTANRREASLQQLKKQQELLILQQPAITRRLSRRFDVVFDVMLSRNQHRNEEANEDTSHPHEYLVQKQIPFCGCPDWSQGQTSKTFEIISKFCDTANVFGDDGNEYKNYSETESSDDNTTSSSSGTSSSSTSGDEVDEITTTSKNKNNNERGKKVKFLSAASPLDKKTARNQPRRRHSYSYSSSSQNVQLPPVVVLSVVRRNVLRALTVVKGISDIEPALFATALLFFHPLRPSELPCATLESTNFVAACQSVLRNVCGITKQEEEMMMMTKMRNCNNNSTSRPGRVAKDVDNVDENENAEEEATAVSNMTTNNISERRVSVSGITLPENSSSAPTIWWTLSSSATSNNNNNNTSPSLNTNKNINNFTAFPQSPSTFSPNNNNNYNNNIFPVPEPFFVDLAPPSLNSPQFHAVNATLQSLTSALHLHSNEAVAVSTAVFFHFGTALYMAVLCGSPLLAACLPVLKRIPSRLFYQLSPGNLMQYYVGDSSQPFGLNSSFGSKMISTTSPLSNNNNNNNSSNNNNNNVSILQALVVSCVKLRTSKFPQVREAALDAARFLAGDHEGEGKTSTRNKNKNIHHFSAAGSVPFFKAWNVRDAVNPSSRALLVDLMCEACLDVENISENDKTSETVYFDALRTLLAPPVELQVPPLPPPELILAAMAKNNNMAATTTTTTSSSASKSSASFIHHHQQQQKFYISFAAIQQLVACCFESVTAACGACRSKIDYQISVSSSTAAAAGSPSPRHNNNNNNDDENEQEKPNQDQDQQSSSSSHLHRLLIRIRTTLSICRSAILKMKRMCKERGFTNFSEIAKNERLSCISMVCGLMHNLCVLTSAIDYGSNNNNDNVNSCLDDELVLLPVVVNAMLLASVLFAHNSENRSVSCPQLSAQHTSLSNAILEPFFAGPLSSWFRCMMFSQLDQNQNHQQRHDDDDDEKNNNTHQKNKEELILRIKITVMVRWACSIAAGDESFYWMNQTVGDLPVEKEIFGSSKKNSPSNSEKVKAKNNNNQSFNDLLLSVSHFSKLNKNISETDVEENDRKYFEQVDCVSQSLTDLNVFMVDAFDEHVAEEQENMNDNSPSMSNNSHSCSARLLTPLPLTLLFRYISTTSIEAQLKARKEMKIFQDFEKCQREAKLNNNAAETESKTQEEETRAASSTVEQQEETLETMTSSDAAVSASGSPRPAKLSDTVAEKFRKGVLGGSHGNSPENNFTLVSPPIGGEPINNNTSFPKNFSFPSPQIRSANITNSTTTTTTNTMNPVVRLTENLISDSSSPAMNENNEKEQETGKNIMSSWSSSPKSQHEKILQSFCQTLRVAQLHVVWHARALQTTIRIFASDPNYASSPVLLLPLLRDTGLQWYSAELVQQTQLLDSFAFSLTESISAFVKESKNNSTMKRSRSPFVKNDNNNINISTGTTSSSANLQIPTTTTTSRRSVSPVSIHNQNGTAMATNRNQNSPASVNTFFVKSSSLSSSSISTSTGDVVLDCLVTIFCVAASMQLPAQPLLQTLDLMFTPIGGGTARSTAGRAFSENRTRKLCAFFDHFLRNVVAFPSPPPRTTFSLTSYSVQAQEARMIEFNNQHHLIQNSGSLSSSSSSSLLLCFSGAYLKVCSRNSLQRSSMMATTNTNTNASANNYNNLTSTQKASQQQQSNINNNNNNVVSNQPVTSIPQSSIFYNNIENNENNNNASHLPSGKTAVSFSPAALFSSERKGLTIISWIQICVNNNNNNSSSQEFVFPDRLIPLMTFKLSNGQVCSLFCEINDVVVVTSDDEDQNNITAPNITRTLLFLVKFQQEMKVIASFVVNGEVENSDQQQQQQHKPWFMISLRLPFRSTLTNAGYENVQFSVLSSVHCYSRNHSSLASSSTSSSKKSIYTVQDCDCHFSANKLNRSENSNNNSNNIGISSNVVAEFDEVTFVEFGSGEEVPIVTNTVLAASTSTSTTSSANFGITSSSAASPSNNQNNNPYLNAPANSNEICIQRASISYGTLICFSEDVSSIVQTSLFCLGSDGLGALEFVDPFIMERVVRAQVHICHNLEQFNVNINNNTENNNSNNITNNNQKPYNTNFLLVPSTSLLANSPEKRAKDLSDLLSKILSSQPQQQTQQNFGGKRNSSSTTSASTSGNQNDEHFRKFLASRANFEGVGCLPIRNTFRRLSKNSVLFLVAFSNIPKTNNHVQLPENTATVNIGINRGDGAPFLNVTHWTADVLVDNILSSHFSGAGNTAMNNLAAGLSNMNDDFMMTSSNPGGGAKTSAFLGAAVSGAGGGVSSNSDHDLYLASEFSSMRQQDFFVLSDASTNSNGLNFSSSSSFKKNANNKQNYFSSSALSSTNSSEWYTTNAGVDGSSTLFSSWIALGDAETFLSLAALAPCNNNNNSNLQKIDPPTNATSSSSPLSQLAIQNLLSNQKSQIWDLQSCLVRVACAGLASTPSWVASRAVELLMCSLQQGRIQPSLQVAKCLSEQILLPSSSEGFLKQMVSVVATPMVAPLLLSIPIWNAAASSTSNSTTNANNNQNNNNLQDGTADENIIMNFPSSSTSASPKINMEQISKLVSESKQRIRRGSVIRKDLEQQEEATVLEQLSSLMMMTAAASSTQQSKNNNVTNNNANEVILSHIFQNCLAPLLSPQNAFRDLHALMLHQHQALEVILHALVEGWIGHDTSLRNRYSDLAPVVSDFIFYLAELTPNYYSPPPPASTPSSTSATTLQSNNNTNNSAAATIQQHELLNASASLNFRKIWAAAVTIIANTEDLLECEDSDSSLVWLSNLFRSSVSTFNTDFAELRGLLHAEPEHTYLWCLQEILTACSNSSNFCRKEVERGDDDFSSAQAASTENIQNNNITNDVEDSSRNSNFYIPIKKRKLFASFLESLQRMRLWCPFETFTIVKGLQNLFWKQVETSSEHIDLYYYGKSNKSNNQKSSQEKISSKQDSNLFFVGFGNNLNRPFSPSSTRQNTNNINNNNNSQHQEDDDESPQQPDDEEEEEEKKNMSLVAQLAISTATPYENLLPVPTAGFISRMSTSQRREAQLLAVWLSMLVPLVGTTKQEPSAISIRKRQLALWKNANNFNYLDSTVSTSASNTSTSSSSISSGIASDISFFVEQSIPRIIHAFSLLSNPPFGPQTHKNCYYLDKMHTRNESSASPPTSASRATNCSHVMHPFVFVMELFSSIRKDLVRVMATQQQNNNNNQIGNSFTASTSEMLLSRVSRLLDLCCPRLLPREFDDSDFSHLHDSFQKPSNMITMELSFLVSVTIGWILPEFKISSSSTLSNNNNNPSSSSSPSSTSTSSRLLNKLLCGLLSDLSTEDAAKNFFSEILLLELLTTNYSVHNSSAASSSSSSVLSTLLNFNEAISQTTNVLDPSVVQLFSRLLFKGYKISTSTAQGGDYRNAWENICERIIHQSPKVFASVCGSLGFQQPQCIKENEEGNEKENIMEDLFSFFVGKTEHSFSTFNTSHRMVVSTNSNPSPGSTTATTTLATTQAKKTTAFNAKNATTVHKSSHPVSTSANPTAAATTSTSSSSIISFLYDRPPNFSLNDGAIISKSRDLCLRSAAQSLERFVERNGELVLAGVASRRFSATPVWGSALCSLYSRRALPRHRWEIDPLLSSEFVRVRLRRLVFDAEVLPPPDLDAGGETVFPAQSIQSMRDDLELLREHGVHGRPQIVEQKWRGAQYFYLLNNSLPLTIPAARIHQDQSAATTSLRIFNATRVICSFVGNLVVPHCPDNVIPARWLLVETTNSSFSTANSKDNNNSKNVNSKNNNNNRGNNLALFVVPLLSTIEGSHNSNNNHHQNSNNNNNNNQQNGAAAAGGVVVDDNNTAAATENDFRSTGSRNYDDDDDEGDFDADDDTAQQQFQNDLIDDDEEEEEEEKVDEASATPLNSSRSRKNVKSSKTRQNGRRGNNEIEAQTSTTSSPRNHNNLRLSLTNSAQKQNERRSERLQQQLQQQQPSKHLRTASATSGPIDLGTSAGPQTPPDNQNIITTTATTPLRQSSNNANTFATNAFAISSTRSNNNANQAKMATSPTSSPLRGSVALPSQAQFEFVHGATTAGGKALALQTRSRMAMPRHGTFLIGSEIRAVFPRIVVLDDAALEVYSTEHEPLLFLFSSSDERRTAHKTLEEALKRNGCFLDGSLAFESTHVGVAPFSKQTDNLLKRWVKEFAEGKHSVLKFLMVLNIAAGRSYNDLRQYPVLPHVLRDREALSIAQLISKQLMSHSHQENLQIQMNDGTTNLLGSYFRNFARPMTQQQEGPIDFETSRSHTHYSSKFATAITLVRLMPFTQVWSDENDGKMIYQDRRFMHDLRSLFHKTKRELVPELFSLPDCLRNINKLAFEESVNANALVPTWCHDAVHFVLSHREVLECPFVRSHIHQWVDLIFGCYQRGYAAENVGNFLPPASCIPIPENVDEMQRIAFEIAQEAVLNKVGHTPAQLFAKPLKSEASTYHTASRNPMVKEWSLVRTTPVPIRGTRKIAVCNKKAGPAAWAPESIASALNPLTTLFGGDNNERILALSEEMFVARADGKVVVRCSGGTISAYLLMTTNSTTSAAATMTTTTTTTTSSSLTNNASAMMMMSNFASGAQNSNISDLLTVKNFNNNNSNAIDKSATNFTAKTGGETKNKNDGNDENEDEEEENEDGQNDQNETVNVEISTVVNAASTSKPNLQQQLPPQAVNTTNNNNNNNNVTTTSESTHYSNFVKPTIRGGEANEILVQIDSISLYPLVTTCCCSWYDEQQIHSRSLLFAGTSSGIIVAFSSQYYESKDIGLQKDSSSSNNNNNNEAENDDCDAHDPLFMMNNKTNNHNKNYLQNNSTSQVLAIRGRLYGHSGKIDQVAASSLTLVSASDDGDVLVWDAVRLLLLRRLCCGAFGVSHLDVNDSLGLCAITMLSSNNSSANGLYSSPSSSPPQSPLNSTNVSPNAAFSRQQNQSQQNNNNNSVGSRIVLCHVGISTLSYTAEWRCDEFVHSTRFDPVDRTIVISHASGAEARCLFNSDNNNNNNFDKPENLLDTKQQQQRAWKISVPGGVQSTELSSGTSSKNHHGQVLVFTKNGDLLHYKS